MKHKIINPDENLELGIQDKSCDNTLSHSAEEINTSNSYWLAYSYPFMPMIDLTFVFDELKRMIKKWLVNKGERTNHL